MSIQLGKKHKAGSKKDRQRTANNKRGKYRKAFLRCVIRTGKWRGKPADITMAR